MLVVPERVSWNSLNLNQEKICTQGEKLKFFPNSRGKAQNFLNSSGKYKHFWAVEESSGFLYSLRKAQHFWTVEEKLNISKQ